MKYLGTNKHGFKRYTTSAYEQEQREKELEKFNREKKSCQLLHYYRRAKQRFGLTKTEAKQLAHQSLRSKLGFALSQNKYIPVILAEGVRAVLVLNMQFGNPVTIIKPPCIQGRLFLAIMKDLESKNK